MSIEILVKGKAHYCLIWASDLGASRCAATVGEKEATTGRPTAVDWAVADDFCRWSRGGRNWNVNDRATLNAGATSAREPDFEGWGHDGWGLTANW